MMGSGGMIVMDEDTCMVIVARYFLEFTVEESCGKCPPCREGNKRLMEMLDDITRGRYPGRHRLVTETSGTIRGLPVRAGQTAPNPVLTTLHYFRDEYEAHVTQKKCPARSVQRPHHLPDRPREMQRL